MDHFRKKKLGLMPLEKRLMLDASLPALTGQVLWLDGADATTILDAQGDNAASGAAFSGSVTTWVDKSSNHYNVTTSVPANQPVYTASGLNGKSVLTFNGTSSTLANTTASILGDDFTAFIVFNRTTGTGRDAVFELGSGSSRNVLYVNEGGTSHLNYYGNSGFNDFSGTYAPGTYTMATIIHDNTTLQGWINAASSVSGTALPRMDTTGIYIGDDSTSADQLQGNIAEIIVYNRDLTADQRHDVETYLAAKWGLTITNAPPVVDTNAGLTMVQGSSRIIQSIVLAASDPDNDDTSLIYKITDLTDHGTLTNINTGMTLGLGDIFTQADVSGNYIRYTHDNSLNFSDSFSFTVSDQYQSSAVSTFNFTMTSSNLPPVIEGWTLVHNENFESGATGWSNNLTETGNSYLTRYLGRHAQEGGLQNTYKTYGLSGSQDYSVITFDFYELDSWDGENFIIYINDTVAFSGSFTSTAYNVVSPGSSGVVSWNVQNTTPFLANFAYGMWSDQKYHFTMIVDNSLTSLKLGFSSTLDQLTTDEAWGVDNIKIYEVSPSGVPGPMEIVENSANGTTVGRVTAVDPNLSDTVSYSIVGGTGAGIFAINSASGVITVTNSSALDYESITSYTLMVQAADNGTPIKTDTKTFTINVLDMPENTAPVIPATGPFSVAENTANNTVVGTVAATDAESHTLTYSITGGNGAGIFAINSATGQIRILSNTNLNYEIANAHTLTISVIDNGFGTLSATRNVTINVTDQNEAPIFSPVQSILNANPNVSYNSATGNFYRYVATSVSMPAAQAAAAAAALNGIAGHVATVTSAAENTYVRGLIGANVWLDGNDTAVEGQWVWGSGPNAGQMFWLGGIGGSVQNGLYANWLTAQPDDSGGNEDYLQLRTDGTWNDANPGTTNAYVIEWEGAAVLASIQNGPYSVNENVAIGTVVGSAHSSDPDVGDTRTYSITGGTGAGIFAIDAVTGQITTTAALNYESVPSYTLNLRVQDAGGLTDNIVVTINVADLNETPSLNPAGPFTFAENVAAGTAITTLSASDPDTGQTLTYSIRSGNTDQLFHVNASTGALTFARSPNFEAGSSYSLIIRVTDNGTGALYAEQTVTVSITDVQEAPTFDPVQQVLASDPTLHYNASTGNFYRFVNSPVNLATARASASAAMLYGTAGHVAVIESAAENAFLTSIITANVWLDGSDALVEGEWIWNSGSTAGQIFWLGNASGSAQNGLYTNWTTGEPNDAAMSEDGLQLRISGSWNDANVTGVGAYVVEWDGAAIIASLQTGPYTINENSAIGSSVGFAHAGDPDGDVIAYSITGGSGAGLFIINSATGQITTTGALDYETTASYTLNLRVTDTTGLFENRTVTINIGNLNEAPVINPAGPFSFNENIAAGTVVTTMTGSDQDTGQTLTYSIQSGNIDGMFTINGSTGALSFAYSPDFEYRNSYNLVIRVTDNGTGNLFSQTTVGIQINDVNEAPVFNAVDQILATDPTLRYNATTGNFYKLITAPANLATARANAASMALNGIAGHVVTITSAAENAFIDSLTNSPMWLDASDSVTEGSWYWLSGGPESGQMFWSGTATGSPQNGFYSNWASGEPNNSGNEDGVQMLGNGQWNDIPVTTSLVYVVEWEGINVLSSIGNGPYTLTENSAPGTSVGFAHAYDPDMGDIISYAVTGGSGAGRFSINSATGEITLTGNVNYEAATSYTLNLRVTDSHGLFDTRTVTINITDLNEVPVLNPAGPFVFNENIQAGTVVTTMTAADQDAGQTLSYSIQSGNSSGMFAIDAATGVLTFTGSPDHEVDAGYNLVIRVTDDGTGTLYAEQTVTINITDLNEVPVLNPAGPFVFSENIPAGTPVVTMVAADQDNGQTLTYSIRSGNTGGMFTINALTGQLNFAASPDFENVNAYTLVIRVTDNGTGNLYAEQTVQIGITDLNDPPTNILLSHNRITENSAIGTHIGNLSSLDQDPGDTHTYTMMTNPGGKFVLIGNQIYSAGEIDYERNQTFNIVIRTDDANGHVFDKTFIIFVDDEMDTYVPSPFEPPKTMPDRPDAGYTYSDKKAPSLLLDTLSGGEMGQMTSFYGMGDFHQILRENMIYEVREMNAEAPSGQTMSSSVALDLPASKVNDAAMPPDQPDRFTNLRQALEFFEQVKEAHEKDAVSAEKSGVISVEKPVQFHALPPNTIDRQFMDVLTYHEQRQARLREALKSA